MSDTQSGTDSGQNESGKNEEPFLIMTGFKKFKGYEVNISEDAVNKLSHVWSREVVSPRLDVQTFDVIYSVVKEKVKALWAKSPKPDLVVHVGLDDTQEHTFYLEQSAHNGKYKEKDEAEKIPKKKRATSKRSKTDCLKTNLDLDKVVERITSKEPEQDGDMWSSRCYEVRAELDEDARFLCEFTYYISLCHSTERCVFVHVPKSPGPEDEENHKCYINWVTDGLKNIVNALLEELKIEKKSQ